MNYLCKSNIQPEFKSDECLLGMFSDDLDAPQYIPTGSHVRTPDGYTTPQVWSRENQWLVHTAAKDTPTPPKRGRPTTGTAKTTAERVSKLRAKRKAAGACQCCGQQLPLF